MSTRQPGGWLQGGGFDTDYWRKGDASRELRELAPTVRELGQENRDRRIREAFTKLAAFGETAEQVRESRIRADHLVQTLEDVSGAVERLWDMAPGGDLLSRLLSDDLEVSGHDELDELEEMDGGFSR